MCYWKILDLWNMLICIKLVIKTLFLQGCDISKDAVVLKADELLGAAEIGLLATVGVLTVKVLLVF